VLSISEVRFRTLDADEIARYVRSGEPMDKAGAYGIQGRAAMFIEEIRGSHSGIVGLPLCETAQLLKHFGFKL
jgi:septum formation protein